MRCFAFSSNLPTDIKYILPGMYMVPWPQPYQTELPFATFLSVLHCSVHVDVKGSTKRKQAASGSEAPLQRQIGRNLDQVSPDFSCQWGSFFMSLFVLHSIAPCRWRTFTAQVTFCCVKENSTRLGPYENAPTTLGSTNSLVSPSCTNPHPHQHHPLSSGAWVNGRPGTR